MNKRSRIRVVDNNYLPPISEERAAEPEAIRDDEIDTTDIPELDKTFFHRAETSVPVKGGGDRALKV